MKIITLDTETNGINGLPIEIAYVPVKFASHSDQHTICVDESAVFDQFFSIGEPLSYSAMAVHHIIEADLRDQPSYKTFKMPEGVEYVIGHNIKYDLDTLKHCNVDISAYKPICTLALARLAYPEFDNHTLSSLVYRLFPDQAYARHRLKDAHNAKADIMLTVEVLVHICDALSIQSIEALYAASQAAIIPKFITFGKYRGTAIKDLPADYVSWLLRQDNLDPSLRIALEK